MVSEVSRSKSATIAQLVEHLLGKQKVMDSNSISSSRESVLCRWQSSDWCKGRTAPFQGAGVGSIPTYK